MKEKILNTLAELREYALTKDCVIALNYHEEESNLMRFANSTISLNTNEHLIRMDIVAFDGRKRASYDMITDLANLDEMKAGIDKVAEMVVHAMPLAYDPTVAEYKETVVDEAAYDADLANLSNEARLAYFNEAVAGIETEDIKLSGIFSNGTTTNAMINTNSEHSQFFKSSDAQITVVIAHEKKKWETTADRSAQKKSDLDPKSINDDISYLVNLYETQEPQQLPLGDYDIVFGEAAVSTMIHFMNWIGYNGGLARRGYSFVSDEKIGEKVLSDKVTLTDDPTNTDTFPFSFDFTGKKRERFPLYEGGVFKQFVWTQDDADEFGMEATGHNCQHHSIVMEGGDKEVSSLKELAEMPREKDELYFPYMHYTNIVNPSKGIVTASSRFGALLLKAGGGVEVLFNVRITDSILNLLGDKVDWLSKKTVPYNLSMSYGARNPVAKIVPAFMKVNELEISHSNDAF